MAQATTNTDLYPKAGVLARLLERMADALYSLAENNPKLQRARKLQSLSDVQLAHLGLRRDDIVPVVFRGF